MSIDKCPKCAGVWFDPGELDLIRRAIHDTESGNFAADLMMRMAIGKYYRGFSEPVATAKALLDAMLWQVYPELVENLCTRWGYSAILDGRNVDEAETELRSNDV